MYHACLSCDLAIQPEATEFPSCCCYVYLAVYLLAQPCSESEVVFSCFSVLLSCLPQNSQPFLCPDLNHLLAPTPPGPNPSWATPSPTYPAPPFLCFLLVLCFPLPLHHPAKTSIEAVQNVLYCPWPSALLRRKWYSASFLSSKGVKHGRERAGIKSPLEKKDKMLHCCSLHRYLSHTGTHFVYRVSLIENSVLVRLHYCQLMH